MIVTFLPEGVVRAMDGYQGVVIDYAHDACHLSQMRSARARAEDAIAAHVAAEVAAERARCVAALELAYDAVPKKYDANNRLNHDWTQYDDGVADGLDTAMQIAALPPITPEAL